MQREEGDGDDPQAAQRCQEGLGTLLARNMGSHAGASEVQALSMRLLNRLLDSLPGLYWNSTIMRVLPPLLPCPLVPSALSSRNAVHHTFMRTRIHTQTCAVGREVWES